MVSWRSKLSVECDVIDEFILQKRYRTQLRTRILLFGDSHHSNSGDSYRFLQFNGKVIQKHSSDFIDSLLQNLEFQTVAETYPSSLFISHHVYESHNRTRLSDLSFPHSYPCHVSDMVHSFRNALFLHFHLYYSADRSTSDSMLCFPCGLPTACLFCAFPLHFVCINIAEAANSNMCVSQPGTLYKEVQCKKWEL